MPPPKMIKKNRHYFAVCLVILLLFFGYGAWSLLRPLPVLRPLMLINKTMAQVPVPAVPWPEQGGQAIGVENSGVLLTHGDQTAKPIASVAKVMLALMVLEKKPLKPTEQGPQITISAQDVMDYQTAAANDQSAVAVEEGEQMSEYQALQALLLPSANNIANTLARWAFGTEADYLGAAAIKAVQLGMTSTVIADASGFSDTTVSTPTDLVLLGEAALREPVLAGIVKQYTADLPVSGRVFNVNSNVAPESSSALNGIKTGNTAVAGGCYLFSTTFLDKSIVGAIVNAPDLKSALRSGPEIAKSLVSQLQENMVVDTKTALVSYRLPWGGQVKAYAQQKLALIDIKNSRYALDIVARDIKLNHPGGNVGMVSFVSGSKTFQSPLIITENVKQPSILWRLRHPM